MTSYFRFKINSGSVLLGIIFLFILGCSSDVNYSPPAGSKEIAITHYSFGKIIINGSAYENDVAIFSDSTVKNWYPQVNHAIQLIDIKELITGTTKTLIIGIGANKGCSVTDEIIEFADSNNIELHLLDTYEAVKLFNSSPKEGLAACFHVNC